MWRLHSPMKLNEMNFQIIQFRKIICRELQFFVQYKKDNTPFERKGMIHSKAHFFLMPNSAKAEA